MTVTRSGLSSPRCLSQEYLGGCDSFANSSCDCFPPALQLRFHLPRRALLDPAAGATQHSGAQLRLVLLAQNLGRVVGNSGHRTGLHPLQAAHLRRQDRHLRLGQHQRPKPVGNQRLGGQLGTGICFLRRISSDKAPRYFCLTFGLYVVFYHLLQFF